MRFVCVFASVDVELQCEVYGWVNKGGDCGIWDEQMRGNLAKRQANFKMFGLDLQIPIFVLQDNRHFVGEAFVQMLRNGNAGGLSLESNVEMMVTWKPVTRNVTQYAANHRTQRLLHNVIIRNQAINMLFGHGC